MIKLNPPNLRPVYFMTKEYSMTITSTRAQAQLRPSLFDAIVGLI